MYALSAIREERTVFCRPAWRCRYSGFIFSRYLIIMNDSDGTFQKVTPSDRAMYGPRKVLVCGYRPEEQQDFLSLLEQAQLPDLPVVFLTEDQLDLSLGKLLALADRSGEGGAPAGRRAVVLSGITQKELHVLISAYRDRRLPQQLWATLTPTSERWPVSRLLDELAAERAAFQRMKDDRRP